MIRHARAAKSETESGFMTVSNFYATHDNGEVKLSSMPTRTEGKVQANCREVQSKFWNFA